MMLPWTKKIFRVVSQPGYRPSRTKRFSTDAGTSRRMTDDETTLSARAFQILEAATEKVQLQIVQEREFLRAR